MTISLVLFSTIVWHSIRSTIFAGKLLGCSLIWQRTQKFKGSLRYCLPGKRSHGSLLSCSPRTITRLFIINFMSPRSGLDWYQENFVSRFSLAWITNSCLFLISAAGTFPSIPFTYFHQEPGTSNQSLIKVSHERISLEVADLLAVRCIVKAFKTRYTEKTRIFTRQGIIYGHPPERQKFSWANRLSLHRCRRFNVDNREIKIHDYAKRKRGFCTTWPSFPLNCHLLFIIPTEK